MGWAYRGDPELVKYNDGKTQRFMNERSVMRQLAMAIRRIEECCYEGTFPRSTGRVAEESEDLSIHDVVL